VISGVVTADREAIIQLTIYGRAGAVTGIDAVIDTGYDGRLTLPMSLIGSVHLAFRRHGSAILANGSVVAFDAYDAVIEWDGAPRSIVVDAADSDPLVGMALLDGYELTIQAVVEGAVTIKALG
jgi:clan AA aspartic protease